MRELKINAVGSSPLIASEIKSITQALLGEEIPIYATATKNISLAEEDTFYVCARSQEPYLLEKIPRENIFVFDLRPTTKFFLDIAQIPANELVCVFNNRLPYTELLIEQCHSLGITYLNFLPVAYEDMTDEEVVARLQLARFVIGIECLTGSQMLLSERFSPNLRSGVKIISGKRTASLSSTGKFLASIADFYCKTLQAEKNFLNPNSSAEAKIFSDRIFQIVKLLKNAVNHAVTGQVSLNEYSKLTTAKEERQRDFTLPQEQLQILFYLKQKISELC